MVTVTDVKNKLEGIAPLGLKMEFDNVGFLVGFSARPVTRILVSLDITDAVIQEASSLGAELIVSHHPLFFSLKSVTDTDKIGRKVTALLSGAMSAICLHTNLDAAAGGVNDALAATVGLCDVGLLGVDGQEAEQPFSYGRCGLLSKPAALPDFLASVKNALKTNGLRYHDAGRAVHKVAVVGGSGGSSLGQAIATGCDTLLTADVKYDVFLEAKECGINLIDGDHFCTENVVTPVLAETLMAAFPGLTVTISGIHGQTAQFF
ncbi:Nif3-like dinuclear metal center hexameric protein [Oscillospiraceae bacterium WX1]